MNKSKYLKLGVELEVEIQDDPHPSSTHISKYTIYGSYPKHHVMGNRHQKHGTIIAAADKAVGEKIETHYDNTINDGVEFIGKPMTLTENIDAWETLLEHPSIAPYIHGDDVKETEGNGYGIHDVGMHIHVSGDMIGPLIMGKLMVFINAVKNKAFIEFIAGRGLNKFCKTKVRKVEDGEILYHGEACRQSTKRGKKIAMLNESTWDILDSKTGDYCCSNAIACAKAGFTRGALWVSPMYGTGDFELRIFKSTVKLERFKANLEFAVAIVDFCNEVGVKELGYEDFGEWMSRIEKRLKYESLFKMMRREGYAQGLVPRKDTVQEWIDNGKLNLEELGAVA